MRGIISWIIFFTAGVLCAGSYFYRLHPEHQPETDLPRVRGEMEDAVERAKRLKRAWEGDAEADASPKEDPAKSAPAAQDGDGNKLAPKPQGASSLQK